ncbi:host cell factor 1-like isoform X2 [Thrips palmi]|uniref:Host cell factor 1-like isoform X2 n=1 Tax=Thrips palmi TaxID=161013 RepID=A0A6P8XVZ5_THRPL|nr:host cell factor 1-like isoform X2 [Thrips palmi]
MEDSEKTTDSMLLEEAMAVTEKSSEDLSAIVGDGPEETSNDLVDETMGMVPDGELAEGVMDNDDIEMADGAAEDSENNNLAPEDSMDAPAALLEGEDGSEEVSQGTLSTSEGFLGDDFMSQPDRMIVQSEPPQQLMEEADGPGEGNIEGEEDDGAIVAEADTTADPAEGLQEENELAEGDEEALLLQQDGEGVALPDGISLGVIADQMEAGSQLHEDGTEAAAEDGQAEESEEGMVLRLEEDDGTEGGDEGVTLLAAGDNLEGALSELEGKIATAPDGTVRLLAGQEALQGMQLMEGDDKPEEEAEAVQQAVQKEIQAQLQAALLKQEEMKMEQEEGPDSDAVPEDQPEQPDAVNESDALATLASAALGHQAPTNGVKNELDEPQIKDEKENPDEPQWMDVGICKGTHCQVRTYYIPRSGQSWDQNWDGITTSTLPDHRALAKLELESGKAYKFRVAAINSCGRGPWSEVAAFKTSLPGFPGAPSAIKIAKTADGAHLSWEPPPIASGVIEDYHVYLAVRTATTDASRVVSSGANQLAFVRIYQGAANQCSVGNDTLSKAHIDMTTKPAILFRISARNEKGIGPATQVRWLQEVGAPNNAARPTNAPRRPATENKPHGNYKRKKSE